jgi:plasmid stabilization system protein ParE
MGTRLDPYIHEHDTAEEAEAFDRALRGRVERARSSSKPGVPHEQVMKEARTLLDAQRAKRARKRG